MPYYAIYNPELGNALVGIAQEPPEVVHPLVVKTSGADYPDLTRQVWNSATLMFDAKPRRRLTKLEFIGRLGPSYRDILTAAKVSADIELFVRSLDWATPEADGTSIDLDDQRLAYALSQMEAAGLLPAGKSAEILE